MDISQGVFFGIIAMVSWGCSDFFIAQSSRKTDPFRACLWAEIIGSGLMLLMFLRFSTFPPLTLAIAGPALISGILAVVANLSFYKALRVGKVAVVMPVASCWSVVTVLLSIVLLREMPATGQGIGIALAIAGAALVSFKWKDLFGVKTDAGGINYAIIAAVAYGIDFVMINLLVGQVGWFLASFMIGVITSAYLLLYSGAAKKEISFPKNAAVFILLVGILDTVAYLAYSLGITREYGSIVAPIGAASPVISVILAQRFFGERLQFNQQIGIVSVIAGLILLS